MKTLKQITLATLAAAMLIGGSGCSSMTKTGKGALIGTGGGGALGAGIGALIGGGKGAGIGAAIGAPAPAPTAAPGVPGSPIGPNSTLIFDVELLKVIKKA